MRKLKRMSQSLCVARTTIGVTMRSEGETAIEESVYGAAIIMPQLARTSNWDKTMTAFSLQSYIFLLLNIYLQAFLLRMMAKEEVIMDGFAGQMYLCDFGANLAKCPGPGCRGPYGTNMTGPRLYDWESITSRIFARDSIKALFPERADEIDEKMDPGEYGLESYECRLVCCFIFMVSCMEELVKIFKMAQLLMIKLPTSNDPWIVPDPSFEGKKIGAIEEVSVRIRGMPFTWKIMNMVFIIVPKLFLWKLTAETGISVLMETSGIADTVCNSVSLVFILSLDELLSACCMTEEILNFVRAAEHVHLYDKSTSAIGDVTKMTDEEILEKYTETQHRLSGITLSDIFFFIPMSLMLSIAGSGFFVWYYYYKHCTKSEEDDGLYISQTAYVPATLHFSWLNAIFPSIFPVENADVAWSMPEKPHQ